MSICETLRAGHCDTAAGSAPGMALHSRGHAGDAAPRIPRSAGRRRYRVPGLTFTECGAILQNTNDGASAVDNAEILAGVREVLDQSLQLGGSAKEFTAQTRLLGEIPELDSMAVLTILTGLEEHFGIVVDDDDVSADTFETVGSLASLVAEKTA